MTDPALQKFPVATAEFWLSTIMQAQPAWCTRKMGKWANEACGRK